MIRVLIVDNTCLACDQFAAALSAQPDIEIVDCVSDLTAALRQFTESDLLLVSTNLPEDGAYQLTRAVAKAESCTQVLILGLSEPRAAIVRYLEAGAFGFLRYETQLEELLRNIRHIHRGEAQVSPDITAALIMRLAELSAWFEEIRPAANGAYNLTRREREVLLLIGRDFTNQDIANHLIIEVGTVKNHVHNILSKLKVNSRREAAAYLAMFKDQPFPKLPQTKSGSIEQYLA